jgi:hypothetical protein
MSLAVWLLFESSNLPSERDAIYQIISSSSASTDSLGNAFPSIQALTSKNSSCYENHRISGLRKGEYVQFRKKAALKAEAFIHGCFLFGIEPSTARVVPRIALCQIQRPDVKECSNRELHRVARCNLFCAPLCDPSRE